MDACSTYIIMMRVMFLSVIEILDYLVQLHVCRIELLMDLPHLLRVLGLRLVDWVNGLWSIITHCIEQFLVSVGQLSVCKRPIGLGLINCHTTMLIAYIDQPRAHTPSSKILRTYRPSRVR